MPLQRLAKILDEYFQQEGLKEKVRDQKILDAWSLLVGTGVAEVSRPLRVRDRVLHVQVANSVWLQELQFHKKLIMEKVNGFAGENFIRDVRFILGGATERTQSEEKNPRDMGQKGTRGITSEERQRINKEIGRLPDPELREVFFRVFSKGLISGKAGK